MSRASFFLDFVLATPVKGSQPLSPVIRATMLATLVSGTRSLVLSGAASIFLAMVALVRLEQRWALLWLIIDCIVVVARISLIQVYTNRNQVTPTLPHRWAAAYAPFAALACLMMGWGTMMCLFSMDAPLASLALMVTAGILGGVASRNAVLPRLAAVQILLGILPIGVGAAMRHAAGFWILVPPLLFYLAAMMAIIGRHYAGLIALMMAEQRNAELVARFDAALMHMPHGLCTIDESGKVIIANRKAAELFGATMEVLKLNVSLPEFIGQVGLAKFGDAFREQMMERCAHWLSHDGRSLDLSLGNGDYLEMTRNPVPDGSAVIIIQDVSERRRLEAEMRHRAFHDPLTGLPNRRYLSDRVDQLLGEFMAGQAMDLAVMYLDLDGFKSVNDLYGHSAGDEVLRGVTDRLSLTMHDAEMIARLGGDEFVIVFRCRSISAAAALARRIIQDVSEPYTLSNAIQVNIGTSIGIAFAVRAESFEMLMNRADTALYRAKTAGKSTFHFWDTHDMRVS
ncbi:MAG: diguanylate cyclase domain-containing protein [Janthinobacterium lividum]